MNESLKQLDLFKKNLIEKIHSFFYQLKQDYI